MNEPLTLCLASSNPGKLKEYHRLLGQLPIRLVSAATLGLPAPPEEAATFLENALAKARAACTACGLPTLAEDAGLCVPALDMQPGLRSARFAPGNDQDRVHYLLQRMRGMAARQRRAFFYCVVVLMRHGEDPIPCVAQGRWMGRILESPQGSEGFGYDPIFCGQGCGPRSAAELTGAEKDRLSHRGRAIRQLRRQLAPALAGIMRGPHGQPG